MYYKYGQHKFKIITKILGVINWHFNFFNFFSNGILLYNYNNVLSENYMLIYLTLVLNSSAIS